MRYMRADRQTDMPMTILLTPNVDGIMMQRLDRLNVCRCLSDKPFL